MTAYTPATHTGDGATQSFSVPFDYLNKSDVIVTVNGTVTTAFTWTADNTIRFNTAPANDATIFIRRITPLDSSVVAFAAGSLTSTDLNKAFKQSLFLAQEERVSLMGEWAASMPYAAGDIVTRGGITYRARLTSVATAPETSTTYWTPLAYASSPGSATTVGQFVSVTDYFTEAEKADIATGSPTLNLTAAIQAAENALGTKGGVLWFPAGTYRFDSTVFLASNRHIRGAGKGATVFKPIYNFTMFTNDVLSTRDFWNDTTPVTEANQPDHDISVEGVTFDMRYCTGAASPSPLFTGDIATPVRYYYARNVAVRNCSIIGLDEPVLSGGSWNGSTGAFITQGVTGGLFSGNTVTGTLIGFDHWQGSNCLWIVDNDIINSNNETAHRPNGYCIGINARGTLPEDHKTTENIVVRNNRCVPGGYSTGGIQFDTLSAGSVIKNITIDGNVVTGRAGGTNQQGIYCRGVAEGVSITNNKIEGVQNLPIYVSDNFSTGGPWAATDPITTTNGSDLVDVALPTLTSTRVVPGNYLLFNSGATAVGGITFAEKYFLVMAVESGVKVTVKADAVASSSATGGGSVSVNVWWGSPKRVYIGGNTLLNCDYANNALILARGESIQIGANSAKGGTYGAVTYASSAVRGTTLTPPHAVWGTIGAPGTGIAGSSGDNVDNFPPSQNPQTSFPSIVIPHCSDPSASLLKNGLIWSTTTGWRARVNGATITFADLQSAQSFSGVKTFTAGALIAANQYLGFGATLGSSGYGIRDNAGAIEVKHSGGGWTQLSLAPCLVSELPSAVGRQGVRGFVTDALSTTFMAPAVGGGANKVPVVSDGTNWLIG